MRRWFMTLVTLLLVLATALPALAAGEIRVYLGETPLALDQAPFTTEGRTLVPLRPLAEALGFAVGYDSGTEAITLTSGETTIQLWVNSNRVMVNGQEESIDVPARTVNGRTFVPVRFVAEKLGAQVNWDEARQAVVVQPGAGQARELLQRAMARANGQPDQIATGQLNYTFVMVNEGMRVSFEMPMEMTMHTYQGNSLISMEMTMPAVTEMPTLKVQMALKDGKMYIQDIETGEWQMMGEYTPGQLPGFSGPGLEGFSELQGLTDLMKLNEKFLAEANITVAGTELVDGTATTRIDVDVPGEHFTKLIGELFGALNLPAEEMPNLQLNVTRMKYSMWVEPENGVLRKQAVDMHFTMDISDPELPRPMHMEMTATGSFTYNPVSQPIAWPDLSGAQPPEDLLQRRPWRLGEAPAQP